MRRLAACFALLSLAGTASAGTMVEATISGAPLQYMKEGAVNGCGVRLVGMGLPATVRDTDGFDVSFNLYLPGAGLVKGGGFPVSARELQGAPPSGRRTKPESLWLRAFGSKATQPRDGKYLPALDPPEALMYITADLDAVLALFAAVADGRQVQIGIRLPKEQAEKVFHGVVALTDSEKAAVGGCLQELRASLNDSARK